MACRHRAFCHMLRGLTLLFIYSVRHGRGPRREKCRVGTILKTLHTSRGSNLWIGQYDPLSNCWTPAISKTLLQMTYFYRCDGTYGQKPRKSSSTLCMTLKKGIKKWYWYRAQTRLLVLDVEIAQICFSDTTPTCQVIQGMRACNVHGRPPVSSSWLSRITSGTARFQNQCNLKLLINDMTHVKSLPWHPCGPEKLDLCLWRPWCEHLQKRISWMMWDDRLADSLSRAWTVGSLEQIFKRLQAGTDAKNFKGLPVHFAWLASTQSQED